MRVLVTCVPQAGHFGPLLPLAQALAAQGDDVLVASGPDAEAATVSRGLAFRPAAPGFGEWYESLRGRTRGIPGDGLAPERIEGYFLPRLFGEVGTALTVDGLLATAREFQPDVILFDPVLFAAPLVARLLGIPAVHHTVGPLMDPTVLELTADALSPIWREFGLNVPPAAGVYEGVTVAICPPSLDPAASSLPRVEHLQPASCLATPPALPVELPLPGEPMVYLTLGTFSNNLEIFRKVLDALAGEPLSVVATIGMDKDPSELAPWPRNAVIERFIPQADLLPHCAAAIHHAGAGTTFGILAHGLPSVAIPQSADNFRIADRIASAGAACIVMPNDLARETITTSIQLVLDDSRYRDAASQLAKEISSMPPASEIARRLRAVSP